VHSHRNCQADQIHPMSKYMDWLYVEFPHSVHVNDQVHGHIQERRYDWCLLHVGARDTDWIFPYEHEFRFKQACDAMAFALTWS
jgi:hypothetical protein